MRVGVQELFKAFLTKNFWTPSLRTNKFHTIECPFWSKKENALKNHDNRIFEKFFFNPQLRSCASGLCRQRSIHRHGRICAVTPVHQARLRKTAQNYFLPQNARNCHARSKQTCTVSQRDFHVLPIPELNLLTEQHQSNCCTQITIKRETMIATEHNTTQQDFDDDAASVDTKLQT